MTLLAPLFRLSLLATAVEPQAVRNLFEWGRIENNADWVLPVGTALLVMLFVRFMYRRDAAELGAAWGWFLTALRTAVVLGLLVLFLQPTWRTEIEEVVPSRVAVLVDTSLSMGIADAVPPGGTAEIPRAEKIASELAAGTLLDELRQTHELSVSAFDEEVRPLLSVAPRSAGEAAPRTGDSPNAQPAAFDWQQALRPVGTQTRLGEALQQVLSEHRGQPLAGIVVLSDGGHNAGIAPDAAIETAREDDVPLFPIGIGSDRRPSGLRVTDLTAPARAFPSDPFTVTGYLQSDGLAGRTVTVQLLRRDEASHPRGGEPGSGTLVEAREITFESDSETVPIRFEIEADATGRQTLCLTVLAPDLAIPDHDLLREADVEVVDRRSRLLLLAGGPTREYSFLRVLLHRDPSVELDVLLQSAPPSISQEADRVLEEFPATREELFEYDGLVAFDPDWHDLTPHQIDLLESWIGEQAGGMIVIPGPVFAGRAINSWILDPAMAQIRALYPVEFPQRTSALEITAHSSEDPWPLDFTREGMEAEFLWLGEGLSASQQAWAAFEGVYGFFPVRGPKPGATVYARFSDPRAASGSELPPFLAGHFYGAGRVFYIASGELWRLRSHSESHFEQLYTKLIRHVSQGRLLRGSARGVLLVGQERYLLGNTAEIRAQLTNVRLEPLDAVGVPLEVVRPDGSLAAVELEADPARAGTFTGRFALTVEGAYRLELPVPESDERLVRRLRVAMPDLERENPQRNDALLSHLARATGGRYYVGLGEATGPAAAEPLAAQVRDRTKTIVLTAGASEDWERHWRGWMLFGLAALLSVEWLARRLLRLA